MLRSLGKGALTRAILGVSPRSERDIRLALEKVFKRHGLHLTDAAVDHVICAVRDCLGDSADLFAKPHRPKKPKQPSEKQTSGGKRRRDFLRVAGELDKLGAWNVDQACKAAFRRGDQSIEALKQSFRRMSRAYGITLFDEQDRLRTLRRVCRVMKAEGDKASR